MPAIVFKRLFEIQILHDYYLTNKDGLSFFELADNDKLELLKQKIIHHLYDIRKQFTFQPTYATKIILDHYKLRFAPTPVGFIVGIEVYPESQNNSTFYKPRIALESKLNLQFSVINKNPLFQNFTNTRLQNSLAANYYFTNINKEKIETALPLSEKVEKYQTGKAYEMGELADFADAPDVDLKEAKKFVINDTSPWASVNDHRWVNETDKKLLPQEFIYSFDKNQTVTAAQFVLLDDNNAPVKTISKSESTPFPKMRLSFKKVDDNDVDSPTIPAGLYTLKIKIGTNPEILKPVYLNDAVYNRYQLGIIDIQLKEQGTDFSLLDNDGFIKTRIDNGVKTPHPIYEIRFRNRRTFWRYKSETPFNATEITATAVHLNNIPDDPNNQNGLSLLISKETRALTQAYIPFQNGNTLKLPSPSVKPLRFSDEKIYSDIFISKANPLLKE